MDPIAEVSSLSGYVDALKGVGVSGAEPPFWFGRAVPR